jgi:hypothetical protein
MPARSLFLLPGLAALPALLVVAAGACGAAPAVDDPGAVEGAEPPVAVASHRANDVAPSLGDPAAPSR